MKVKIVSKINLIYENNFGILLTGICIYVWVEYGEGEVFFFLADESRETLGDAHVSCKHNTRETGNPDLTGHRI